MSTLFDQFREVVASVQPRAAVVFGSGLADAASPFVATASIPFADVPGLMPPTVAGHKGRLSAGHWAGVPAVVSFGRVHFYEGHPWDHVTRLVRLIAEFGVKTLVLTNAAGGIRDDLQPGDLMTIRKHVKLLDAQGWKAFAPLSPGGERLGMRGTNHITSPLEGEVGGTKGLAGRGVNTLSAPPPGSGFALTDLPLKGGGDVICSPSSLPPGERGTNPYSLLAPLPSGIYASLTGPCYETPAEIRALRAMGADAVGMSTAVEAETAAELGLVVAGISCITNKAAGLSAGPLSHHEVEETARHAVAKLAEVISGLMASAVQ